MTGDFYVTQSGAEIVPENLKEFGERLIFRPLKVDSEQPLAQFLQKGYVESDTDVLVAELPDGSHLAVTLKQLSYHHVVQGEVNGDPYMLWFCVACNAGIFLSPVVKGKTYDFRCVGLYNGMALMEDDQTKSYWTHFDGECVKGEHQGDYLEPIGTAEILTVEQAVRLFPDVQIIYKRPSPLQWILWNVLLRRMLTEEGYLPFIFPQTMGQEDTRCDRMELGLGIWSGNKNRFYPTRTVEALGNMLTDTLDGKNLLIYIDPAVSVLKAVYTDAKPFEWHEDKLLLDNGQIIHDGRLQTADGTLVEQDRPQQLYVRWYGFSYSFPGCEIYGG